MDIEQGERAEAALDAFIERCSRRKDLDEESELWRECTRTYQEKCCHAPPRYIMEG